MPEVICYLVWPRSIFIISFSARYKLTGIKVLSFSQNTLVSYTYPSVISPPKKIYG